MKKILSHIIVFVANFYLLSFSLVVLLMFITAVFGPIPLIVSLVTLVLSISISLIYQIKRNKFSWFSFGEKIISNTSKDDICTQSKTFKITRIPLLILILLTLVIFSNSGDGVSDGRVYTFGNVAIYGFLARAIYFSFTEFTNRPSWIPIGLITLFLSLFYYRILYGLPSSEIKTMALYMYGGLGLSWLLLGFIYLRNISDLK